MIYRDYNVRSQTNVKSLSDSIYQFYLGKDRGEENLSLKAVGAAAVNKSLKSVIIANKSLAGVGKTLYVKPAFENIDPNSNFTGVALNLTIKDI